MARVELAPEITQDFDRIVAHLMLHASGALSARLNEIVQAIDVLAHSPLIGRPPANGKRELVIGRKSQGYVALYQYVDKLDTVFVLALRSQREPGYART
ncbi:type II toxin-antitoxin system RelE/ParE family toxin [Massilia glaciei]|uniref:Type II toxin-antitoxin system RelE/ParE family toxin n=1 Tax=Massilia glaciei TaxID=1524097 RepID=A0A2U2HJ34_9BURK|nr:type II toxin-antitoxin system RelE/ParE family toxin [Massilia glaciei]PWF46749.1 type II toxin-antitoxin system RelE/ParE family toxin [Massilia glaciei]